MQNALSRFATSAVPTIPDRSLSKYLKNPAPAQQIDADPKTAQARVVEAALIPDARRSERSTAWPEWTHDPALLVGVGVCFVVWLASTKLMRR